MQVFVYLGYVSSTAVSLHPRETINNGETILMKKEIMNQTENVIKWEDFSKIDIRVGTIIGSEVFKEALKPAYKIVIDFGELGTRKTSAQITKLYNLDELLGKQVVAVVNFPPKQIANIQSECLILGVINQDEVILLTTDRKVKNGLRIG